jgi:formamidopyrimidine-DNA glycosylase
VPELPEVETVRRGLEAYVVGKRIDAVEVGRLRSVRRTSAQAVVAGLTGATVVAARRRGKYLVGELDTGHAVMIHLRMSGQLRLAPVGSPRPAHTHVVLVVGDDELRFIDPRTFGEVVVFDPANAAVEVPELGRLGLDPVLDPFGPARLRRALSGTSRGLKVALSDQHRVAGLGNIYTDEVLHRARLAIDRPVPTLTRSDWARLATAMTEILGAAVEAGGSTLGDGQYVDVLGRPGSYQLHHRVHARAGQTCPTCRRAEVVRGVVGGRYAYWCPRCQR